MKTRTHSQTFREYTEEERALLWGAERAKARSFSSLNEAVILRDIAMVLHMRDLDSDVCKSLIARANEFCTQSENERILGEELSDRFYALCRRNNNIAKAASE